jgi:hypothetical protein
MPKNAKLSKDLRFFFLPSDAVRILCHGKEHGSANRPHSETDKADEKQCNNQEFETDDYTFRCKTYSNCRN